MSNPITPTTFPPGYADENRGHGLFIFGIVMTAMTCTVIALRFWSRSLGPTGPGQRSIDRFWWDDWFALAVVVGSPFNNPLPWEKSAFTNHKSKPIILGMYGIMFYMLTIGLGRHMATLSPEHLTLNLKLVFIIYYIYDSCLVMAKTSALFFLSRCFPSQASPVWFTVLIWIAHIINILWYIGIIVGTSLMCRPIAKNWNPFLPGTCGSTSSLWIGHGIPAVFVDLLILIIPIPMIWVLQMTKAKRFAISAVFLLGYCAIIVSVGRLVTTLKTSNEINKDLTYGAVPLIYWVSAECPVLLLGVSLPTMWPLGRSLARRFGHTFGSTMNKTNRTATSSRTLGSKTDRSTLHRRTDSSRYELGEIGTYHAMDSQSEILRPKAAHMGQFRATVSGGETEAEFTGPKSAIQVENEYRVER